MPRHHPILPELCVTRGLEGAEAFFAYARERQEIYLRRAEGTPGPWTADPILSQFRFCNVFREDDTTTRWYAKNIRQAILDGIHLPASRAQARCLVWATIMFRWFNRVEVGQVLLDSEIGMLNAQFRPEQIRDRLLHEFPSGPWTTGAYMIRTPTGLDKIDGICWILEHVYKELLELTDKLGDCTTLHEAWCHLRQLPFIGDFYAYEIVTDLRWSLLYQAEDINLWANPGPGAARGYGRVDGTGVNRYNRAKEDDRDTLMLGMQGLLANSRDATLWPWQDRPWELREVEHTLCEFDKYMRVLQGEGVPKQRFHNK